MTKFLTLLMFLTLSVLGAQESRSDKIHLRIAELALEAEDVINGQRESDFSKFILSWEDVLKETRLEKPVSKTRFVNLKKTLESKLGNKKVIGLEELKTFRLALFREGLSEYCSSDALMSDYISKGCGNCDAQTRFVLAMFEPFIGKLDPQYKFGIQAFKDHIRPVLVNTIDNLLIDLVYGRSENLDEVDGHIFDYRLYYLSFVKSLYKRELKIKDYIKYEAKSEDLFQTNVKSYDGYLSFGKQTGTFNSGDTPDRAQISYNDISTNPINKDDRNLSNENEVMLSMNPDGKPITGGGVSFFAKAMRKNASYFSNFPDYEGSEDTKTFPLTIEYSSREQLKTWYGEAERVNFRMMPSSKIVIHDKKILRAFESRDVIGKNNLIYMVFKKHLNKLYVKKEFSDLISITEDISLVNSMSINRLRKVKKLATQFSELLTFRKKVPKLVFGDISIGFSSIWESSFTEEPIREYINARASGEALVRGNEVEILKGLSKLSKDKAILYFQIESILRGKEDDTYSRTRKDDALKLLRQYLTGKEVKLTDKREFDPSKVVFIRPSKRAKTEGDSGAEEKEPVKISEVVKQPDSTSNEIRLYKHVYIGLYAATPINLMLNPRFKEDFFRNIKDIDRDLITNKFSETYGTERGFALFNFNYNIILDNYGYERYVQPTLTEHMISTFKNSNHGEVPKRSKTIYRTASEELLNKTLFYFGETIEVTKDGRINSSIGVFYRKSCDSQVQLLRVKKGFNFYSEEVTKDKRVGRIFSEGCPSHKPLLEII